MKIGTVTEIKTHEYRVGLTPACVKAYVGRGHEVMVQKGAGEGAGFSDEQYIEAGAKIVADRETVFAEAEMIVKVKEPQADECKLFREGQLLYTYLHLAADEPLTMSLLEKKVQGVAYETIETANGGLPCLRPMSAIAGRLSIQEGAKYLEKTYGGRGVLLGGVPGIERGKVAVIGGGEVGLNAAKMAVGLGAEVTILDISADRLAYLDDIFGGRVTTLYSNDGNIEKVVKESDLIVGAVLLPGKKAPHLIKREHLKMMKKGAVIADVAVDQGGCIETTKATTHSDPIFIIDDVVHYCVANMPGAVARSSTLALTSTTLPYGLLLADKGLAEACKARKELLPGVNVLDGKCTYEGVAEAFGLEYTPVEEVLY
ncbi:alanine dehydrogenase [Planctomycetota bacterium]|nr:alanine dehydrogenase [Planctomycetota bacterium]